MTVLQRVFLAVVIPVGGAIVAFGATGVLFEAGMPSPLLDWSALITVPVGVLLASVAAPRILPDAIHYPRWRRTLAGTLGIGVGALLTRGAQAFGLDADALSKEPSLAAVAQEAVALTLFYGGMVYGTYAILGPSTRAKDRAKAAEQPDAADEARASSAGRRGPRS